MPRTDNHDEKAWRARAQLCREIADTFNNPETRRRMYAKAQEYERLAIRVEGGNPNLRSAGAKEN
jgi:hypothetical protein